MQQRGFGVTQLRNKLPNKKMNTSTNRPTRRRKVPKTRTLHTRVDDEMFYRLELKADRMRRDLSELVRDALASFLVADA